MKADYFNKELRWLKNPAYDGKGEYPPMLVGDRFLIAVPVSYKTDGTFKSRSAEKTDGYDFSVIVADEIGFNDANGESWFVWDWSDVEFYIPLDGARKEEEQE